jgi:uncharacterized protein
MTVTEQLKKCRFSAIIRVMTGIDPPTTSASMLLRFQAANVRSFRDPVELSLQATTMAEPGVPRLLPWRESTKHPVRVLPAAGIFGANASGKTNLLRVMDDMRRLVVTSFSSTNRNRIYRKPFRLDPDSEREPSEFGIDLILDGIRHEYSFSVDDSHVIEETAQRYTHGKAATIFHRSDMTVELGVGNRAKGRAVKEILRPNSLFLSAAAAADHPDLTPLYEWFENNLLLAEAASRSRRWLYTTHMLKQHETRPHVLEMLHAADLGVTDARTRKMPAEIAERLQKAIAALNDQEAGEEPFAIQLEEDSLTSIVLSHQGLRDSVEFDISEESLGTLVWLGLIGPVLDALADGTVLLADELESSLHPALVAQLVRMFQNPTSNPNDAQLIFNSHEAGLLGNSVDDRILGRDQVWFTEKLHDGRTRLYPLTDLTPRPAEAVGKRYLAGRYGATPIISPEEFAALAAVASSGGNR